MQAGASTSSNKCSESDRDELREIFKDASATTDMNPDLWIPQLRNKLVTMLKTPLKQEFTAEVYRCIFQLCMFKKRFRWLCSNETHGWTSEEAKHFSLITRLSLNEIHILLPHIMQHLTSGNQVEHEDGKVMSRPASHEEYQQFDVHLMILEDTIQSLVHDEDNDDDDERHVASSGAIKLTDAMEPSELKSLLDRMKEALTAIFDYLKLVQEKWAQLVKQPESLQFCASLGALRIALVWVSEDIGSFQAQCKSFFIDLIVKCLLARELLPDTMPDLLVMALDAVCSGSGNDEMKQILKRTTSYRDALQAYLDFIQDEHQKMIEEKEISSEKRRKRSRKEFKLRCALIKDLLRDP